MAVKTTCNKCNASLWFDDVVLDGSNNKWSAKDQIRFHERNKCAYFDFRPTNYLWFRSIKCDGLIPVIASLPAEINNVLMAYTGESEKGGIIRALNQLFVLKHNYDLSIDPNNKLPFDHIKADVYDQTIKNEHCGSLYLLVIRSSEDYKLVQTSEFNAIHTFRRLGQYLFYNSCNGTNALNYGDHDLFVMQQENYRRIEHKLKQEYYLKFTENDIEQLGDLLNEGNRKLANKGKMQPINLSLDELKGILNYLYNMKPEFFVDQESIIKQVQLTNKSFFEEKKDASVIMKRAISYCNNFEAVDNYDPEMGEILRSVNRHPYQLRLNN